jgi:hypothetical protein
VHVQFWSRVKRGEPDECWPWLGAKNKDGYGYFKRQQKLFAAHREAFTITTGEDITGKHVCHTCDNPPCCNPAHLFSGTKTDNMRDAAKKKRLAMPTRKCINAAVIGRNKQRARQRALAVK